MGLRVVDDADDFDLRVACDFVKAHDDQPRQVGDGHLLETSADLWADKQNWPLAGANELARLCADSFAYFLDRLRRSANEQSALGMLDSRGDFVLQRRIERQDEQATFGVAIAGADRASQAMADIFGQEYQVFGFGGVIAQRFEHL